MRMRCVVCLSITATHACVPCGHKCVCEQCAAAATATAAASFSNNRCPLCRSNVSSIIRIYDGCEDQVDEETEKAAAVAAAAAAEAAAAAAAEAAAAAATAERIVESRYMPPMSPFIEYVWQTIDVNHCKACRRSTNGVCYTHSYVNGLPIN